MTTETVEVQKEVQVEKPVEKSIETPVEQIKVAETVPAINPETTAVAEETTEPVKEEPVTLSDEDIKTEIQQRKEFAQKRIDKLVAQGHAKDEEVGRLREEIVRMREQLVKLSETKVESPETKSYTDAQLDAAEAHAIEISESSPREAIKLLADINKERIKNERRSAINEVSKPTPEQVIAQEEAKNYTRFVSQHKSDDPDYDFTKEGSAVRKIAPGLYETNREYYDSFGALRSVELAADSLRAVERLKTEKSTNRVQKQLVKERVKTSISPGDSSVQQVIDTKPKLSPVAEYFAERENQFKQLSGLT